MIYIVDPNPNSISFLGNFFVQQPSSKHPTMQRFCIWRSLRLPNQHGWRGRRKIALLLLGGKKDPKAKGLKEFKDQVFSH